LAVDPQARTEQVITLFAIRHFDVYIAIVSTMLWTLSVIGIGSAKSKGALIAGEHLEFASCPQLFQRIPFQLYFHSQWDQPMTQVSRVSL
jgi:hypothetical protein